MQIYNQIGCGLKKEMMLLTILQDSSRGVSKRVKSNATAAEYDSTSGTTSFDTNGFSLDSTDTVNKSTDNYVAWQWKCNGGTTTSFTESGNNPGGTIQTNTTAGFSIITTTGTGATGTIAHGLGAVPHWWLSKQRSNAENWAVYHVSNTSAPETEILSLNTSSAQQIMLMHTMTLRQLQQMKQFTLKMKLIQTQELMCIMFLYPYKATVNLVAIQVRKCRWAICLYRICCMDYD